MSSSSSEALRVPGLDPVASARWRAQSRAQSPWIHEEVARRMVDRLQWIKQRPERWLHWQPLLGGLNAHRALRDLYPQSHSLLAGPGAAEAMKRLQPTGSGPSKWLRWLKAPTATDQLAPGQGAQAQMLWANMALHLDPEPLALLRHWREQLQVGGFLMLSCLGPDSLIELRRVFSMEGWPAPSHPYTDMHDWGDMLIEAGFAEPIMDMERIVLTYGSAESLLADLRDAGRNLFEGRFSALRGRQWRTRLIGAMEKGLPRDAEGRLQVALEIVYGHAFKPAPKVKLASSSAVSIEDMRTMLRSGSARPDMGGKS